MRARPRMRIIPFTAAGYRVEAAAQERTPDQNFLDDAYTLSEGCGVAEAFPEFMDHVSENRLCLKVAVCQFLGGNREQTVNAVWLKCDYEGVERAPAVASRAGDRFAGLRQRPEPISLPRFARSARHSFGR